MPICSGKRGLPCRGLNRSSLGPDTDERYSIGIEHVSPVKNPVRRMSWVYGERPSAEFGISLSRFGGAPVLHSEIVRLLLFDSLVASDTCSGFGKS